MRCKQCLREFSLLSDERRIDVLFGPNPWLYWNFCSECEQKRKPEMVRYNSAISVNHRNFAQAYVDHIVPKLKALTGDTLPKVVKDFIAKHSKQ